MTPEKLVAAAQLVTRGAVFALNWSADLPDPPMFARLKHTHKVLDRATGHDDVLHGWNTQSSSQWDGFRHVKNVPNGFYDGIPDEDHGVPELSFVNLAICLAIAFGSRLALGLVLVFFVSAGIRFDLHALLDDPSTLALVPLFLIALLVVRGLPAWLYRGQLESRRDVVVAGLLQATSLPFMSPRR